MKSRKVCFKGIFEHHHQAAAAVHQSGDLAIVHRGVERSVVLRCPDGCGDVVTANLDPRTGPSWRRYGSSESLTLFPSIWRESGCRAHFIIWRGEIDWLNEWTWIPPEELKARVFEELKTEPLHFTVLANRLNEIPWDVAAACFSLVREKKAREGTGSNRGHFCRLRAFD